ACTLGLGSSYAPPPATGPVCYAATGAFLGNTLTSDRAEWEAMQADLRAHPEVQIAGPTVRWLYQSLLECHLLGLRPSPAVPMLTALGGDEMIVDIPAIEDRVARWPGGRLLRVAGARHELLMESHARRAPLLDAIAKHFSAYTP
ncbi:MAG: alpha/beta hydrolase, partial [Pseudotabrizicola sp.]